MQKERVKRAVWLEEKLPGATLLFLLVFFFLGGSAFPACLAGLRCVAGK